jgi:hypothetical protein
MTPGPTPIVIPILGSSKSKAGHKLKPKNFRPGLTSRLKPLLQPGNLRHALLDHASPVGREMNKTPSLNSASLLSTSPIYTLSNPLTLSKKILFYPFIHKKTLTSL